MPFIPSRSALLAIRIGNPVSQSSSWVLDSVEYSHTGILKGERVFAQLYAHASVIGRRESSDVSLLQML